MRILIFSWRGSGHPDAGGAERATHEHAKAWVKAGHKVWLFTSHYPGAKKKATIDGVNIVRQGSQVLGVHLAAPFWYFQNRPFDLVVDQFHGIPFFTPLYVRSKKLAIIHETAKEVWFLNQLPQPINLVVGALGFFIEPWIFKLFYRKTPFLTGSMSTKRDLVNWGILGKNISIIQYAIHLVPPKPLPGKERKKTAIFLGALTRDKGIEDAVETFWLISKKEPQWQFWVVGKGEERYSEKLKVKSAKLGLRGKIRFFGYVSEKKKFELLARAHALINPSVREGWGLVNIEANSVGTPVVAYDVAGCRDSVRNGETGFLVKRGELESMSSKILELINDVDLYKRVQRKALLWSKKFSWEKATRLSLELIENL